LISIVILSEILFIFFKSRKEIQNFKTRVFNTLSETLEKMTPKIMQKINKDIESIIIHFGLSDPESISKIKNTLLEFLIDIENIKEIFVIRQEKIDSLKAKIENFQNLSEEDKKEIFEFFRLNINLEELNKIREKFNNSFEDIKYLAKKIALKSYLSNMIHLYKKNITSYIISKENREQVLNDEINKLSVYFLHKLGVFDFLTIHEIPKIQKGEVDLIDCLLKQDISFKKQDDGMRIILKQNNKEYNISSDILFSDSLYHLHDESLKDSLKSFNSNAFPGNLLNEEQISLLLNIINNNDKNYDYYKDLYNLIYTLEKSEVNAQNILTVNEYELMMQKLYKKELNENKLKILFENSEYFNIIKNYSKIEDDNVYNKLK
jgi:hypothetical protein